MARCVMVRASCLVFVSVSESSCTKHFTVPLTLKAISKLITAMDGRIPLKEKLLQWLRVKRKFYSVRTRVLQRFFTISQ